MKTKELIRQLQEADPSGELEVAINGDDIAPTYSISKNEEGNRWYHINVEYDEKDRPISMVWRKGQASVFIHTDDTEMIVTCYPDIDITFEGFDDYERIEWYNEAIARWREEGREIERRVAKTRKEMEDSGILDVFKEAADKEEDA